MLVREGRFTLIFRFNKGALRDEIKDTNYCRNPDHDPIGPWCVKAGTTEKGQLSLIFNKEEHLNYSGTSLWRLDRTQYLWPLKIGNVNIKLSGRDTIEVSIRISYQIDFRSLSKPWFSDSSAKMARLSLKRHTFSNFKAFFVLPDHETLLQILCRPLFSCGHATL